MSNPPLQPLPPSVDFSNEDDSYLLLYMSDAEANRELAEAAFTVFVNRHWDMLIGFCHQQRLETFGDGAKAFVNGTFLKAFKHAGSFELPQNADAEEIRRKVQKWLFTILKRLFLDARRKLLDEIEGRKPLNDKKPSEPTAQADTYNDISDLPAETKRQAISARRRTLMQQFMSDLSDRDRAILIQTQDHIDPYSGKTEPPPEELEALGRQFGIPADHIRVYRKRILDRLQVFIIAAELSSSS